MLMTDVFRSVAHNFTLHNITVFENHQEMSHLNFDAKNDPNLPKLVE